MTKIVTLTLNPTIDKSSAVDTVASEIKLRCDPPTFDPGGGGINVSRAVKKLGGEALAIYLAGGGPGDRLNMLLDREGVPQQTVPISGETRESLTVYERSTGLQYRFGMPGPEITADEWQAAIDLVLSFEADYIVASGSLPPGIPVDFYAQLVRAARAASSKVIVDTSGEALQALSGSGFFLAKPNLREIEMLAGEQFKAEEQLRDVVQQAIRDQRHVENVVVSMGSSGAALISATDFVLYRPPTVPIQSKVGAGDSMVAGIVFALAEGRDMRDAVRYGVAAGSAAVMTPGTELCRKEDTDHIYERIAVL